MEILEHEIRDLPYIPIKIDDDGVPVFCSDQIDLFGIPDYYGIISYRVIQTKNTEQPIVSDYKMEINHGYYRDVHHYSRLERFICTLHQLLGSRGKVPKHVVNYIKFVGYSKNPYYVWDSVRDILKSKKWSTYYNRIPTILDRLGYPKKIEIEKGFYIEHVIDDFKRMHMKFDSIVDQLSYRKYFPNLRFIALKLLQMHGVSFGYKIPFVRTPRKRKILEDMWDILY